MPSIFDSSSAAVGSIQASLLTEAEFQAIFGVGWVLARGQSVAGSRYASLYASAVPDFRGQFLRGKNNGRADGKQDPDGERDTKITAYQADKVIEHYHQAPTNSGTGGSEFGSGANYDFFPVVLTLGAVNSSNVSVAGTETRPRNMPVNFFIRIN